VRHWTGLALAALGAWLLWSGLAHRRRVLAAGRAAAPGDGTPAPTHPSLAFVGDFFPGLVGVMLVFFGVKATLMYLVLDAGRLFSPIDLGGLLFLLASYGAWLVLRTRYRAGAAPAAGGRSEGARLHVVEHAGPPGDAPGAGGRAGPRGLAARVPAEGRAA
jgi:hypothetical protein